jgi:hypothetical protein
MSTPIGPKSARPPAVQPTSTHRRAPFTFRGMAAHRRTPLPSPVQPRSPLSIILGILTNGSQYGRLYLHAPNQPANCGRPRTN